jgi:transposase
MSQSMTKKYPAAFKERAVKLAVESDQPIAQPVRDLGVHENTLHTSIPSPKWENLKGPPS